MLDVIDVKTLASEPKSAVQTTQALVIPNMPDDQLVMYRQAVVEQRQQILADLSERQKAIEAEIQARLEKNGGRAFFVKFPNGASVTGELADQWSTYSYDIPGLRKAATDLFPPDEAAKIVKHVEERVTVESAHDEPGPAVSINALIKKYGPESPQGKALSACISRAHLGKKLEFTVSK